MKLSCVNCNLLTILRKYHWIQDRMQLLQFNLIWKPGAYNLADFFTKAHPCKHFLSALPLFNSAALRPRTPVTTDSHPRLLRHSFQPP